MNAALLPSHDKQGMHGEALDAFPRTTGRRAGTPARHGLRQMVLQALHGAVLVGKRRTTAR